jgi:TolB protein
MGVDSWSGQINPSSLADTQEDLMSVTRNASLGILAIAPLLIACVPLATATFPGKNGRIVFVMQPNIFTMNPDGSDVKQLTSFASTIGTFGADWSPDGTLLVFGKGQADFSGSEIWIMKANGSDQHQLLNDPSGFDDEPRFSPDGMYVVFQRCLLPATVTCSDFRIRADGTEFTQLTPYTENTDEEDLTPAYSPDGKTIAFFAVDRDGIISAIDLMNADGSDIRRITPPALEGFIPDWSPDGTRIAFSTRALYPFHTINSQLWVMNSDGVNLKQLTFPGDRFQDVFVSWSPQGDAIVFERDNATLTSAAIYILTFGESTERERMVLQLPMFPPLNSTTQSRETRIKNVPNQVRRIESGGSQPRWGPAPQ